MFDFMFWVAVTIWLIEVFLLYLMNLCLLGEVTFFNLILNDNRVLLGFMVSIIVFIFFLFLGGFFAIYMIFAIILGWAFFIYSLEQEEKELKNKRMGKNREEIEWLERNLDEESDDFGPLLRLGSLYEEVGNEEKALEFYKKATSKVKTITLTDTERKIKQIEYSIRRDEEGKSFICKHCKKKNYSTSLLCEKCHKMLHSSYLAYIRYYAPVSLKVGVIIFILSAFLFGNYINVWVNTTFYFLVLINYIMFQRKMKR